MSEERLRPAENFHYLDRQITDRLLRISQQTVRIPVEVFPFFRRQMIAPLPFEEPKS